MAVEAIMKVVSEVSKKVSQEIAKENLKMTKALDKSLNSKEIKETEITPNLSKNKLSELDKPLNSKSDIKQSGEVSNTDVKEAEKVEKIERMEPQIQIEFKCPGGMDRKEFTRQIKGQERGLNSQTLAENIKNREAFEQRKLETGNGRDLESGKKAQEVARQKATQSRIETNQKKGMSYSEAKAEAESWIKNQAALHNPDQIAGGNPSNVSRMGDANVNSSIGAQWRTRVEKLADGVNEYAKDKSPEELANTKMNVKLVVV
ncbi:polymorphic toxin type 15 domain-containing protein [uncultured Clostridium sp.]|uniref:polymorphic toxin type 15 domain-containing protein n=1 Tax=uncultured Clostridium sp. TaxID=59620 RepID=UPI0025FB52DF|nr:polymorphic toxin type 15 domain-containing protein [uncultured Clostridium sp.]